MAQAIGIEYGSYSIFSIQFVSFNKQKAIFNQIMFGSHNAILQGLHYLL